MAAGAPACDAQSLVTAVPCLFCQLSGATIGAIKIRLLCAIANGDMSIACDATSLIESAKCLESCVPVGMYGAIEIYLLCYIAQNGTGGGGGGGTGGVVCSTADPVAAPTNSCTIHYRTDNGAFWFWSGSAWVQFIAP